MDYKTIRDRIEDMAKDNHKDFVKAVISMEKGINDESALDKLYEAYMANDTINLLHEDFDYIIEDLREQGQIKDLPYVQGEKDDLVNIVGNIVGEVDVVERENKNGEAFKVANFSVVSKDDDGNKVYHNCSAYGEKSDVPKAFKQGDFVKLFGQLRTSIDDNGKEHGNVRIFSSKLLKAKEQMKGQDKSQEIAKLKSEIEEREKDLFYADSWEQAGQIRVDIEKMKAKLNTLTGSEKGKENDKKSIIGAIKEYQAEDKEKPKESKENLKKRRDKCMVGVVFRTAPALFCLKH
ncbi:hypothetical protein HMPREF1042_0027 [Streptococcus constellatus subsp. pharyngis SK1060 = CCUG 46377]|uniref:Single-stranded DNA-binding protein n=1 Tax=Streptococcus constellatus subsp. pharyngis SK1060 = CCUG 46377 TaxID=1035184 RepID=F9P9A2_STRCV|nr:hypothetical protein HMPREF1042_0027 [Streptococcus constellatus subsp. pharyngis SK1060 = CCUG 46377]